MQGSVEDRARPFSFRIGAPFDMGIRIGRVVILRGYSPEADCLPHQSSNAFGLHLLHDLSAIAIHRSHADVKLGRDGVAGEPVRYQIKSRFGAASTGQIEPRSRFALFAYPGVRSSGQARD
jgi:hypothetical protein